ncbi:MAG: hypothetical protein MI743_05380 [Sneathiellales bacterium]|nr:hypothetical protein [Sneathiellales bacterium]
MGTNGSGLFFQPAGKTDWIHVDWTSLNPNGQITALHEMPDGSLYLGTTNQGLFHINAALTDWKQVNLPPTLSHISILRASWDALYLSNDHGALYQLTEETGTYRLHPIFATKNKVQILDIYIHKREILVGLDGSGLARSADEGRNWSYHSTGLCSRVSSLLYHQNRWLLAMHSPELSFSSQPKYRASISSEVFSRQLDQALLSELLISALTQAHVKLPENPLLHPLQPAHRWLLLSAPAKGHAVQKKGLAYLLLKDKQNIKIFQLGDCFPVVHYEEGNDGLPEQYEIFIHKELTQTLMAYPEEVFFSPALKTDPQIKQVLEITKSHLKSAVPQTKLYFSSSLKTLFDASKCVINANLIELSQGQLIENETLGDGNAALSFQNFPLKSGQLVFTQKGENTVAPILTVTVEGEPYHPVSDLLNTGPHDKVYVLTLDEKGIGTITFGDGINGSRLPSGLGNVKATYRINMPIYDASDEKAQFILTEPPYGLSTIASPAEQHPAKTADKIKKGDTVSLNPALLPKRLVTLSDFETVSASFSSVTKSKIHPFIFKRQKGLLLTLAGKNPEALNQEVSVLEQVRRRISHLSLAPEMPLRIVPALNRPFCLSVILTVQNGLSSSQKIEIAQKAYQTVNNKYGYQAASIGASVLLHDIQNLLMQGIFIKNVSLTALHFENLPPTLANLSTSPLSAENPEAGEDLIYLSEQRHAMQITLLDTSDIQSGSFSFPANNRYKEEEVC